MYLSVCGESKKQPMARSWRNFFRRSKEPEESSATTEPVEVAEATDEETDGVAPVEEILAPEEVPLDEAPRDEEHLEEAVEPEGEGDTVRPA